MSYRYLLSILFLLFSVALISQDVLLTGTVTDQSSELPIEFVTVYVKGTNLNTETDPSGKYSLKIEEQREVELVFSRIGYETGEMKVRANKDRYNLDITLINTTSDLEVTVTDSKIEDRDMIRESTEVLKLLPSTTGNLESVLPHIALGARSGTGGELSSQYNVRGGNYDENLVYVNDFEIFRPQLLRSSQQEGLSFPNIDLIRDLSFSSGGFESKYGDKMSSVLDIKYKRPTDFHGSVSTSLLGLSTHLEGSAIKSLNGPNKLRYLIGYRYKTNKYLLSSLDTQGEYNPNFTDIQAYLTYDVTSDFQVGLISNYNTSQYDFNPVSRSTAVGLTTISVALNSVFEGSESDAFKTGMGGLSLTYLPERDKNPLFIKLLASTYRGQERESVDIAGFYRLSQIETDLNSDNAGEEIGVLGVGTQQQFSRNRLFNRISTIQLKGGIELQSEVNEDKSHFVQWGASFRSEYFDDRLNEWERLDSAGFSLPYSDQEVLLRSVLKAQNIVSSNKITGYVQDTYTAFGDEGQELRLSVGSRFSYWDFNGEFNISPRAQLLFKPKSKKDISYKLAGGVYYQTPFYRELRRTDGTINQDLKAQKSIHVVAGMTTDFYWKRMSDKPFRFIAEAFYKKLDNLVSYDIDNVRIRYSGENDASGSAMGLDMRLNGEFVPGAESWFNMSFLRVRESLDGVQHRKYDPSADSFVDVSTVSRPTDQFVHFSLYFQDYLPRNENFKVNFLLTYATGLPFGLPENNREIRNTFTFKDYRRVDMGLSLQLWNEEWKERKPTHFLRSFDNVWLSLEIFNLMGIENVSSNTWIKTIFAQQFAVPNNLTNRRINLRLRMAF